MLREGGNAVDAAVAAVLTSFVTESPLTGLGAGGFMLVHAPDDNVLLDFFVAVPGQDGVERRSELDPIPVYFSEDVPQVFNVGAASCGVPGTAAGLWEALQRFGSMPMAELVRPAVRSRATGVAGERRAGVHLQDPRADPHLRARRARRSMRPEGRRLREGDVFRFAELGGSAGAATGPRARSRSTGASSRERSRTGWWSEAGRSESRTWPRTSRSPAYPARGRFRGRDVLTNPPPSSGGHPGRLRSRPARPARAPPGWRRWWRSMEQAQAARTEEFLAGLYEDGFAGAVPRSGAARRRPLSGCGPACSPPGDGRSGTRRPARLDDAHHGGRRRRAAAPASPARTAPAPGWSSPAPASTSTTCWARRT